MQSYMLKHSELIERIERDFNMTSSQFSLSQPRMSRAKSYYVKKKPEGYKPPSEDD